MTETVESNQTLPNSSELKADAGQSARLDPPKSEIVKKLLRRGKGATLAELQGATAWQTHSIRAFLSGLRQKGEVLFKELRKSGETAYRIEGGKAGAPADA